MHRMITSFKDKLLKKASFGACNFKRLTKVTIARD